MLGNIYDRINDYGSVKIGLASPNDIRSWSFGEVRKPETINYRTYRPEKDGLFCERIFGPERDWECSCGKYKGTKFKGIICDRCGVKVTHSRVRRKRMGHINLSAPVVHIWFFKAIPNHLGTLLAMKTADLEKVIYFQDYVVTDPGDVSPLKAGQLLSQEEFREALNKYGSSFKAAMGAEAIKAMLANMATSLIIQSTIETTPVKARAVRRVVDRLVTLAKRGDLHARRQAAATVRDKVALKKLFEEIGPQLASRAGGYTRALRLGIRRGDGAPVSVVHLLVEKAESDKETKGKKKKAGAKPSGKAAKKEKVAKEKSAGGK